MKTPADYHWDWPYLLDRDFMGSSTEIAERHLPDDSCFLSIRFPNESRLLAPSGLLDGVRSKATSPDHFHLTLLVAEQCSDDQLALFLANLSPIMPFSVEVTGLKLIDGMDSPVLVWAIDSGPALGLMQSELYNAVVNEDIVISPYSKPSAWIPHITVAYDLDSALAPGDLPQTDPFRLMVNSFTIGRSYEDYFEVQLPRGVGDVMFVQRHRAPPPVEEIVVPEQDDPFIERNRHGQRMTVTLSDLSKLVHGEQVIKGVLRRMVGIDDGPFSIERAGENMYLPAPSPGAAGGGGRGTDGSKQDGSKTGMKKQDTGFNADGKKRKWGLPHHVPVELSLPGNEDLQELMDSLEEWEGDSRLIVDELLHEEKKELDPADEKVQKQIIKWFDNPDAQDNPLGADQMYGMTDGEIQRVLEREARTLIGDTPEIEEAETKDPGAAPKLLIEDKVNRDRVYTIARDGDEIVAIVVTTVIEENDYRVGQLADGAQAIAFLEKNELLPPTFRPENYTDESFETAYLFVDWLAVKREGHGFGRQMLGEIFRQAADTDGGVYLEATDSAKAFYREFEVNTTDDDTLFWTAEEVKEWSETVVEETEAFTEDELVQREDINEVLFGSDQPEFRPVSVDDDSEPLDGGYTIGNLLWIEKPRPWKRQFMDQIEEAEFMTDEDAAVLDAALPPDQHFPDERETMLQGVQRAMDNLVRSIFKKRHGKHVGQKGREGDAGGAEPGFEHEEGSVEGAGNGDDREVFHGTGAEAARSIMVSGLQIDFADDNNFVSDVVYAAADRRDALNFAARSTEENYALITIDGSLVGSEPTISDRGELMFGQDIPAEAIVIIEIYQRGFQRKDDELIETIERSEEESSQLFIAAAINETGEYSILGPGPTDENVELQTLADFRTNAYQDINAYLQDDSELLMMDDVEIESMIEILDGILEESLITESVVTFRGMDLEDQFERNFDALEGEVFSFRGYTPTAVDVRALSVFVDDIEAEEAPVLLEIRVPEGTPAIYMDDDQELLLDRGLQFRVVEVGTTVLTGQGVRSLTIEVVPGSGYNQPGNLGLTDVKAQREEEAALQAGLEGKAKHAGDTSQNDDTSQNREVSTNDETGSESEIDETRRDYWVWEKGDITLLDKAGFEASQEAAGRQAEKFSKEGVEAEEAPGTGFAVVLMANEGKEGTVEKSVVGPLRRVVIVRHGKHIDQEGEEGRRGGSAPGFEHAEGSVEGEGDGGGVSGRERWDRGTWVAPDGGGPRSTTVYHGTTDDFADEIAREGLKRGEGYADRGPSVYFTENQDLAETFASYMADEEVEYSDDPGQFVGVPLGWAVVEFEIPAESSGDVVRDYMEEAWRIEQDVSPEWIKAIHYYEAGEPTRTVTISEAGVERHGKHIGQEGEKGRRGGSAEGFEHEEGSVEGTTDTSPTEGGGKAGVSTNRKAVKGNEFLRRLQVAMKDNERAGYVTEYSLEEYEAMKALYLSDDGMAGIAILDHGDGRIEAVSGFNRGGARGIVLEMLKESVDRDGVNYVEAFDPLQHYYAKAGFVVDTWSEWNPEFAPENWNMEVLGERDYFTMKIRK